MKNLQAKRNLSRLIILCVAVFAVAALSSAGTPKTSVDAKTSVEIVNKSNKEIRNVYLSHVNLDDWGYNQLGDTTILPGQSFTLKGIEWDQQQVQVIAEDQDGCFLSTVVTCGQNASWKITDDTTRDCGS